jgi:small acid-soluble spore protein F (minor alpha/beta-type SASP)
MYKRLYSPQNIKGNATNGLRGVEMNKKTDPNDKLKLEIASELGLREKVMKYGWKSLSAKETGRIGGLVSKRRKALEKTDR